MLFETVAKMAGINVLFDPEYNQQQTIRAQSIESDATRRSIRRSIRFR